MMASLSMRQVIEAGPKMPSIDPAARAGTKSRAASKSRSETNRRPFETERIPLALAVYATACATSHPNPRQILAACPLDSECEIAGCVENDRSAEDWSPIITRVYKV